MATHDAQRVLIIGAGEVGAATAKLLIDKLGSGSLLHIRTLSSNSLKVRLGELRQRSAASVTIQGSAGDVFFSSGRANHHQPVDNAHAKVEYLLAPASDATLRESSIYRLIDAVRPDIIIDTVNSAYVTRSAQPPFHDLAREALRLSQRDSGPGRQAVVDVLEGLVLGNGPLIVGRYIAALELALRSFGVGRYVRVSTTGLGGMGFNCPYTHGESNLTGVGEALAQKLSTSGALHQLLWNLHHTGCSDVMLVVPAALIGWENVKFGPLRSNGWITPRPGYGDSGIIEGSGEEARTGPAGQPSACADTVYVPAGDSSHYTAEEMALATALGQFEAITREEVARAVVAAGMGDRTNDLLTFMDKAALAPSYAGAIRRTTLLREMRELAHARGVASVASGNFGPAVSKALFELHFILAAVGQQNLPDSLFEAAPEDLSEAAARIVGEGCSAGSQALALGHSIILPDRVIPLREDTDPIGGSAKSTEIDLRAANIAAWQERTRAALPTISQMLRFTIGSGRPGAGDILAGIFMSEGKRRHHSFPLENLDA